MIYSLLEQYVALAHTDRPYVIVGEREHSVAPACFADGIYLQRAGVVEHLQGIANYAYAADV